MLNKFKSPDLKRKTKSLLFGKGMKKGLLAKIAIYVILSVLGFIFLYPLFYMISTSFKNIEDLLDSTVIWIPNKLTLENYRTALMILDLPRSFSDLFKWNSLYKTIVVVGAPSIAATVSSALIGYGFARFRFRFKKVLLICVVISFIIPSQIILLPQFVWFNNPLNILGTIWTYILPAISGQGLNAAVFILIFYSFFSMIPKSLDESAYIDGANETQVFWHIGIKLSIQPIVIVFLFNIVWYWNDYYRASFFLSGSDWTTLPLQLSKFESLYTILANSQEVQMTNLYEPLILAGTILTVLPLLLLYFVFQRMFTESIDRTGITGE
ncbi:carbohydrate ABC transporter permease [Candidatus Izemoplasma sp. B36]|uniref:carbohydrate ABC transporter permease n=1 Tax=Candidatus Izemoplasma sp. B36 TaxID=3242468 RepID=UPI0035569298